MNAKEYFDLLVENSANGNFPAINDTGDCVYNQNGKRCGVGILIPDGMYSYAWEHCNILNLISEKRFPEELIPEGLSEYDLLDVQKLHDSFARVEKWDHESFVQGLCDLSCFKQCLNSENI